MKRTLFILTIVFLLVFSVSCGKTEEYSPSFSLGKGFVYENGVISGTVYTLDTLFLRDIVETEDDLLLTADFTEDYYSEEGEIPLKAGKNSMVLTFMNGEKTTKIPVEIECLLFDELRVDILDPEKTYRIGEHFDRATIAVIGVMADGKEMGITNYTPEYEFSSLGKSRVGIDIGGFYESFSVMVTEEYMPILDSSFSADGVTYLIIDGEATLVQAENVFGFFAVPAFVISDGEEVPVTAIGGAAFESAEITAITIPESIETIGESAFAGCALLESATLPDGLRSLGKYAFLGCESLLSVEIPDAITEIATGTFRSCQNLFRVKLPDCIVTIGSSAFEGCETLSSLEFPESLRVIGESAFEGCTKLSSVVIASLEKMRSRAFAMCENLSVFAVGKVETLGTDVLKGSSPAIYAANGSTFSTYAVENGISFVPVSDEVHIISVPMEIAIEDGYPYASLVAVYLEGDEMRRMKNYEILYDPNACGYVEAKLIFGDYEKTFPLFVSYTETVALDTDSRGAVYEVNPAEGTARLLSVPQYVRKSEVYNPENKELFLVPTAISRPDGEYRVTEIAEGAFDACLNKTEFFVPQTDEP